MERLAHPPALHLALELRPGTGAPRGDLVDEDGTRHAFAGWLGLLTLLDAAHLRSEEAACPQR
jgi:hypothetical protein